MCGATISYPGFPGPGGPAIVDTMVRADGGRCEVPYGKHDGGFFHTDALLSGADVATLIFYNFEMVEARSRGLDAGFFSLKDWGVPDFCQLVLFTTPQRLAEAKPALRRLVLALRRATGLIKTRPERARAMWDAHTRPRLSWPARLNPLTMLTRRREARAAAATFDATLHAFVNDNSLARDYFDKLENWLVETKQVDADAVSDAAPYWTNEIAL